MDFSSSPPVRFSDNWAKKAKGRKEKTFGKVKSGFRGVCVTETVTLGTGDYPNTQRLLK